MGGKIRLILADPDESFRAMFIDAIESDPNLDLIAVVGDGAEALELTERLHPDILLLDLLLPNMDGLDVISTLNKGIFRPEIIVQSCFTSQAVALRCRELEVSIMVTKPCSMESILQKVHFVYQHRETAKPELVAKKAKSLVVPQGEQSSDDAQSYRRCATELLQRIGASAHYNGYYYMREAVVIKLLNSHRKMKLTTELYPEIAKRFQTTSVSVERDMRTMTDALWANGGREVIMKHLNVTCPETKPANARFIAMLAERIGTCCDDCDIRAL